MKIAFVFASFAAMTSGFAPQPIQHKMTTQLNLDRRDFCATAAFGLLGAMPAVANAKPASTWFFDEKIEEVFEPAQQATDGKLDLNSAFVGEYMDLRGMFPHAAGKIASNGPYQRVSDIYKIPDLTDHDRKLFKQYEHMFAVNPPGRAFHERINARVST